MFESVYAFADFEVNPPIVGKPHEVIFVSEFLWDDIDLNLDVFWAVEGCAKVEVGEFHGHELCIWL